MNIVVNEQGKNTVISVQHTELDTTNTSVFKRKLTELIEGGKINVILDLSSVQFISSSGIGAIVAISKAITGKSGNFKVVISSSKIRDVFKMTGINNFLEIFDTLEEATQ